MSRLDGKVAGLRVTFPIRATNGEVADLMLDTGFQGELALDAATLVRLGFDGPVGVSPVELGDGTHADLFAYQGRIGWLGGELDVNALMIQSAEGAMGLGLLRDVQLTVNTKTRHAAIESAP